MAFPVGITAEWSPGPQRRCAGKNRYSKLRAGLAAAMMSDRIYALVSAYRCIDCSYWHVGRAEGAQCRAFKRTVPPAEPPVKRMRDAMNKEERLLQDAIRCLQAAGREPTAHNLQCERFRMLLEDDGMKDVEPMICYEDTPMFLAEKRQGRVPTEVMP